MSLYEIIGVGIGFISTIIVTSGDLIIDHCSGKIK
jgi:hypothetical protein